jgi:hypothetical protein
MIFGYMGREPERGLVHDQYGAVGLTRLNGQCVSAIEARNDAGRSQRGRHSADVLRQDHAVLGTEQQ